MRWILLVFAIILGAASGPVLAGEKSLEKRCEEAEALEKAGKAAEALDVWKAIVLAIPPGRAGAFTGALNRANALLRERKAFDELVSLFREAHERRPDDGASAAFLGQALEEIGALEEAKAVYRELGGAGGAYAWWAWQRLGGIRLYQEGKRDEATARIYLRSLKLNPQNEKAAELVDYIAGVKQVWERDFETARSLWMDLASVEGIAPAWRARACLYVGMQDYQQGRFQEAEAQYRKAASLVPGDPEPLSNLGLVQISRGREKEALETFDRVLEMDPDYADALEVLGVFHLRRNRPSKARAYFEKGLASAVKKVEKARSAVEAAAAAGGKRGDPALEKARQQLDIERYRTFRFEHYLRRLAQ